MYSNTTSHYDFPQYSSGDIPNILIDVNNFFSKLDTILYEMANGNTSIDDAVTEIRSKLDELEPKVATLETSVTDVTTLADTLDEQINNSTSGIIAQLANITNTLADHERRITALE